jgi:predicted dinucleotide-binding enzyme
MYKCEPVRCSPRFLFSTKLFQNPIFFRILTFIFQTGIMNIGILGTGTVGETIATALLKKRHDVMLGSRAAGSDKARAWVKKSGKRAQEGTFDAAARFGDVLFICLNGEHALRALESVEPQHVAGKIVIDVTNPLDFTHGMPPRVLEEYSAVSLGERIQQALPNAYVVKTLNTVTAALMVDARHVARGAHSLFLCGNDKDAKNKVGHFLTDNFYWKGESLIDLGGIAAARVAEAYVPLWVQLYQTLGTPLFNLRVVR